MRPPQTADKMVQSMAHHRRLSNHQQHLRKAIINRFP
jgi:hypothetical protein